MSAAMTKQNLYRELILDAKRIYSTTDQSAPVYLSWCDDCAEQINLWSYWQGSLTATIMVVGQDWGCPEESAVMENIRAMPIHTQIRQLSEPESHDAFEKFNFSKTC